MHLARSLCKLSSECDDVKEANNECKHITFSDNQLLSDFNIKFPQNSLLHQ